MKASLWLITAAAFVLCSAFSTDGAGKACVKQRGERGVGYDVHKAKVRDAYGPGGRRLVEGGHRVYEVEVPALLKRDKPVICTMSLATGHWEAPAIGSTEQGQPALGSSPYTARGTPAPGSR